MNKTAIALPVTLFIGSQFLHGVEGREENPHTNQETFTQEFVVGRATIIAVTSAIDADFL